MSTPSDPQRGGQQPDQTPRTPGRSERESRSIRSQRAGDRRRSPAGTAQPTRPVRRATVRRTARPVRPARTSTASQYAPGHPPYGQTVATRAGSPARYRHRQYGQAQYGSEPAPTVSRAGTATSRYSPYGSPALRRGGQPGRLRLQPVRHAAPYPAGLDDGGAQRRAPPRSHGRRPGPAASSARCRSWPSGVLMVLAIGVERAPAGDPGRPALAEAGVTPDLLVSAVRVAGGLMAVLALLYVIFAVLAFRGRNWARILVTVMTVGFALLLLSGLVTGATRATPSGLACCCVILVLQRRRHGADVPAGGDRVLRQPARADPDPTGWRARPAARLAVVVSSPSPAVTAPATERSRPSSSGPAR